MINEEVSNLSNMQIDALREIGNVGAGNAATSLSMLLNRPVQMKVPRVSIVLLDKVWEVIGEPEELIAGIYLRVQGAAPGSMLFILPWENACKLVDILLGKDEGSTRELGEIERSALMEVGNILVATYLNALNMFTGLEFYPSVPALATDMQGAIISAVVLPLAEVGDYVLIVETEYTENGRQIVGHLLFLPDPGSLTTILAKVGVIE